MICASMMAASRLSGSDLSSATHCCWHAAVSPAARCSLASASSARGSPSRWRSASLYSSVACRDGGKGTARLSQGRDAEAICLVSACACCRTCSDAGLRAAPALQRPSRARLVEAPLPLVLFRHVAADGRGAGPDAAARPQVPVRAAGQRAQQLQRLLLGGQVGLGVASAQVRPAGGSKQAEQAPVGRGQTAAPGCPAGGAAAAPFTHLATSASVSACAARPSMPCCSLQRSRQRPSTAWACCHCCSRISSCARSCCSWMLPAGAEATAAALAPISCSLCTSGSTAQGLHAATWQATAGEQPPTRAVADGLVEVVHGALVVVGCYQGLADAAGQAAVVGAQLQGGLKGTHRLARLLHGQQRLAQHDLSVVVGVAGCQVQVAPAAGARARWRDDAWAARQARRSTQVPHT
jgi:hypothetical protein